MDRNKASTFIKISLKIIIFVAIFGVFFKIDKQVHATETKLEYDSQNWKTVRNLEEAVKKHDLETSSSVKVNELRNDHFELVNSRLSYIILDRSDELDYIQVTGFKEEQKISELDIQMSGASEIENQGFIISEIADKAFYRNSLISLSLTTTVQEFKIGHYAFADNQLKILELPSNTTVIGNGAFEVNRLESIKIPKTLTEIGEFAFSGNILTEFLAPSESNLSLIMDGAFFRNSLMTIDLVSAGSLSEIGRNAFGENQLTEVNIPNSVTILGLGAFYENQIKDLQLGNGITRIEQATFAYNKLERINLPNGVEYIGVSAFRNNNLSYVDVPDKVSTIAEGAFRDNRLIRASFLGDASIILGDALFDGNPLGGILVRSNETLTDYRSILTPSVMKGVTKRTMIGTQAGVGYKEGTPDYIELKNGGEVELQVVIADFYHLDNLTNYNWVSYMNESSTILVQWMKDNESTGYLRNILKLSNVTTANSGVYHARIWLPWFNSYFDLPYIRISVDPI